MLLLNECLLLFLLLTQFRNFEYILVLFCNITEQTTELYLYLFLSFVKIYDMDTKV
jgi:hypothetical protein